MVVMLNMPNREYMKYTHNPITIVPASPIISAPPQRILGWTCQKTSKKNAIQNGIKIKSGLDKAAAPPARPANNPNPSTFHSVGLFEKNIQVRKPIERIIKKVVRDSVNKSASKNICWGLSVCASATNPASQDSPLIRQAT